MKKALVPSSLLWDKGRNLCGATRIDVCRGIRPLTFTGRPARAPLITGGVPVALLGHPFAVPSEVHSSGRSLPRSHPAAALCEVPGPDYSSSSSV